MSAEIPLGIQVLDKIDVATRFEIMRDSKIAKDSPVRIGFMPLQGESTFQSETFSDPRSPRDLASKYGFNLDDAYEYSDATDRSILARALQVVKNACYIRLNNGLRFFIFEKPIELQPSKASAMIAARKYYEKNGARNISPKKLESKAKGLVKQRILSFCSLCITHDDQVKYSEVPPRMTTRILIKREYLYLTHDFTSRLQVGDYLTKVSALEKASHPDLPGGKQKVLNCLTDYWGYVIPFERPVEYRELCDEKGQLHWDLPIFEAIQSLKAVPKKLWSVFISYLEGKEVERFEHFIDQSTASEVTRTFEEGLCKGGRDNKNGQCFYRSAAKIRSIIGPYVIFEYIHEGKSFIILDSPLYGVALRVMKSLDAARDWASGKSRDESLVLKRFCHDPQNVWDMKLEEYFHT